MNKFPGKDANKAVLVSEQPVSTFSADVDTASYAFVRRLLAAGTLPPADAVRVEEMVNYFPYHYSAPRDPARPFAIGTGVVPSPWQPGNQLLHIAVRGYDLAAAARPRANVVLLVDVSGSMMPADRLPLLKQAFGLFTRQLRDSDSVAIVTYANGTNVALEPTAGKEKGKIADAIGALQGGGGTAGGAGLRRAYELAARNFDRKAVNRVILATDGDFNLGMTDPRDLERFIANQRKSGVYLSILGVGEGNLNDALMQRLAQAGNGNAAYIDSLLEARKALGEELGSTMFPIANDVKLQVEFNPAHVAAYRLVGYETRMLDRQDFKDDKVDAGDIGAGHTVTAIYEITPAGAVASLVDPPRYAGNAARKSAAPDRKAGGDELCFVKLRYKLPGEASSRQLEHAVRATGSASIAAAPDDQRFAIAVAAFGQKLRGEPQLAAMAYPDIATLANGARGADPEGYRAEFVKLVRMAEALDKVGIAARP
ncbi:vWA domain-containing protein [Pseudoduganella umbonata]|uniref:Ca-activated chloride channel family protein n=1 Tax=Pseudoduganella umbonata TaxID=864828 RepID=A0A7W5HAE0_9BURK|nr:von Willebrand factor type A domain-containing protein [Pseudoduganella umbonata]MBB3219463.1 Ca-activated chloride channel family protein [Pseudoduganella umbonata]